MVLEQKRGFVIRNEVPVRSDAREAVVFRRADDAVIRALLDSDEVAGQF